MDIRLENLTKSFQGVKAVDNLHLTINNGELVSLLGPSGCGKSTTLSMIAGLLKPTEGNIFFDEKNVNEVDTEKRGIGMVFQSYALYPHMTVMQNILFPLKILKIPKREAKAKVIEVAKLLHLEDYLKRKPKELSGGQQQRVAIARAVVKEPKILLLDEPLSNLDARLRIELREEIRKLQRKLNITTIFVTHDQEEAMSISDKIILMNRGVCQQYSTPKKMYMNPANKFVAGFLGNPPMNFLNKNNEKGNIIGIRPEDLRVNNNKYDIKGEITSVQTLGKEVYVKLKTSDEEIMAVLPWDSNYDIGDNIYLEIKKIYELEN